MVQFVAQLNAVIINPLIALLFALAAVLFAFGLFQFVAQSSSDEAREKGKRHMIYAVIGLVIMVSAFALVRILLATFGIELPADSSIPTN